ncbi:2-oxo-4-hydroxy-4-carboxy-5-ureidoimidazoline decarboxylase [Actinoplanes sp. DH11]|uniref:2-oxo-4-hydroxy-4-carboxy-5-ureidoimidazoline decarboxylase n=1 Tax=Actinoplanes sp. DH11 TaxID=2857011 RepID=UPI001E2EA578|nr:2-oxo-4-hydroxy-4-carboxy-5-ureidoimidazoline decarboxylase [Actinoplanes sp. DH11]
MSVEAFNALPAERLERELFACLAAPAWGAGVAAGRPFRDRAELLAAADAAARSLSWDDVRQGLSAHPRIGERAAGASQEASWSRAEQSAAAASSDDGTRAALVEANRAYEDRFGHVFLIFASGRSQGEILDVAKARLGNDEATERAVVTDELRKIALLRLERVLDAL